MANRNFSNGGKMFMMQVNPVIITGQAVIGAAGAVTSSTSASTIKSIARQSTGVYLITMQPNTNFSKLLHLSASAQSPASGLSGVLAIECQNAPDAAVAAYSSTQGGTLTIKCLDAAGALVDPASGSTISFNMFLSNSSV